MGTIRMPENLAKLTKASTTAVTLGASRVNIGALQYVTTATLTLNTGTIGVGGVDATLAASSVYYVYAVISGSAPALIGSLNASLPSGYTQARKVGAFTTGITSQVLEAFYYGQGAVVEEWKSYTPTATGYTGSATLTGKYRRVGTSMEMRVAFTKDATAASGSTNFYLALPTGFTIDSTSLPYAFNDQRNNIGTALYLSAGGQRIAQAIPYSTTAIVFMNNPATSAYLGTGSLEASCTLGINVMIPIAEWAGSGTQFVW